MGIFNWFRGPTKAQREEADRLALRKRLDEQAQSRRKQEADAAKQRHDDGARRRDTTSDDTPMTQPGTPWPFSSTYSNEPSRSPSPVVEDDACRSPSPVSSWDSSPSSHSGCSSSSSDSSSSSSDSGGGGGGSD